MNKIKDFVSNYKKVVISSLLIIGSVFGVVTNVNNRTDGHDFTLLNSDVNITHKSDEIIEK